MLSELIRSKGVVYGFCVIGEGRLTLKTVGDDQILSRFGGVQEASFGPGWHYVTPTENGWAASTDVQVSAPPPVEPEAPVEG